MANRSRLSTSVLLTCAAIGVAAGVLQAGAGALSGPVSAALPILYGLVLGVHVLPGVIAQDLLRAPWVALITHLIAALVASAVVPLWIGRYIGTALLIGGLQEGVAALGALPALGAVALLPVVGHRRRDHRGRDLVRRRRHALPALGSDRLRRAVPPRAGAVDRRRTRDRRGAAPGGRAAPRSGLSLRAAALRDAGKGRLS